nr:hypothetical protein [Planctomycetota bacterium]
MAIDQARRAPAVQVLSGRWTIAPDPENRGRDAAWFADERADAVPVPVPGIIQQALPDQHGVFWYYHRFACAAVHHARERVLLRFGLVDYIAQVWLNGAYLGMHEGGETPFALDATAALKANGSNLLAVRVLNPTAQMIDEARLRETPHRCKTDGTTYHSTHGYNYGGIILPVELAIVPAVRVADVWVRADPATGGIRATISVVNDGDDACDAHVLLTVAPAAEGSAVVQAETRIAAQRGTSAHVMEVVVPQHRLWQLEDPYLYRVWVELDSPMGRHDANVRTGFRDFRLVDGFVHLNGKRVFFRSSHTGNHFPLAQVAPVDPDLVRRDLLMAKASGYNAIRFIAGMPYPEQLDYCDEIGLMVYEENLASWFLEDSPHMARRFDLSLREMVARDRNHPSLVIWGLLNETRTGAVFDHAVASLALLRSLDPTRLVLLGSGRWDGRLSIGSASNPGTDTWQAVWGEDGPGAVDRVVTPQWGDALAYVPGAGDAHLYPRVPLDDATAQLVRGFGAGTRPVFLSEFGIGSLFDVAEGFRGYDRFADSERIPDRVAIQGMLTRFESDWTSWDLDVAYPFPEDFLRDSARQMVAQRRSGFDLIRANPQICGYNLTGTLDHGLTGEGPWTFWRRWKPGAMEMLQDGWAPLRWCLFAHPRHAYAGRPLTIEAVLADESTLLPGDHPVRVRIFAQGRGTVWERSVTVTVPEGDPNRRPLAVPVLRETISAGLDAGEYVLAACLERGGIAVADRLEFRVSDAPK